MVRRPPTTRAKLYAFPSGKLLSKPKIPRGPVFGATDPRFAIIRPVGWHSFFDPQPDRAAAIELATGQAIVGSTSKLDVCGRYYVAQHADGKIGLYERGKGLQATVDLETR